MSHHWEPGEGPSDRGKAKEHVKKLLAKPEHRRALGHPDDDATRDDDLFDPGKQKPDGE